MALPADAKVTTEILWRGAFFFALADVIFVTVLSRLIKPSSLRELKWTLAGVMAVFFCGLFAILASYMFWDSVYQYVFPEWSRWVIPPLYGLLFAAVGLLFWRIAFRLPGNPVTNFCILGGSWGMITHLWAIERGILEKPPMLQGSSSVAAVILASVEFIFYWCLVLTLSQLLHRFTSRLRR
jgi:hypothetical protein